MGIAEAKVQMAVVPRRQRATVGERSTEIRTRYTRKNNKAKNAWVPDKREQIELLVDRAARNGKSIITRLPGETRFQLVRYATRARARCREEEGRKEL
jgi:hypothetical protein